MKGLDLRWIFDFDNTAAHVLILDCRDGARTYILNVWQYVKCPDLAAYRREVGGHGPKNITIPSN